MSVLRFNNSKFSPDPGLAWQVDKVNLHELISSPEYTRVDAYGAGNSPWVVVYTRTGKEVNAYTAYLITYSLNCRDTTFIKALSEAEKDMALLQILPAVAAANALMSLAEG